MSTEVTPESLRTHAEWLRERGRLTTAAALQFEAKNLECESKPLPTVPGWYPSIVVERGGESCTGALLADDDGWRTAREVGGRYGHWVEGTPDLTIRWAEQDGKTPGQTLWEATRPELGRWTGTVPDLRVRFEQRAAAVLAAHGTPTLTTVGEHPEPGTRGLLPVMADGDGRWFYREKSWIFSVCDKGTVAVLADPRPDGAHE